MLFPLQSLAQRVHDIDQVQRLRRGPFAEDRDAGLFLLEQLDDGLLVAIHELRWIEVGRLALQDLLGQLERLGLDLHVRNVLEIFLRVPDLVGIAERGGHRIVETGWKSRATP